MNLLHIRGCQSIFPISVYVHQQEQIVALQDNSQSSLVSERSAVLEMWLPSKEIHLKTKGSREALSLPPAPSAYAIFSLLSSFPFFTYLSHIFSLCQCILLILSLSLLVHNGFFHEHCGKKDRQKLPLPPPIQLDRGGCYPSLCM